MRLGDSIRALELDVTLGDGNAAAKADYGPRGRGLRPRRRLNRKRAGRARAAEALDEGRWAMHRPRAARAAASRPAPSPCFCDPRHGPSARDVDWTPRAARPRGSGMRGRRPAHRARGSRTREVRARRHDVPYSRRPGLRPVQRRVLRRRQLPGLLIVDARRRLGRWRLGGGDGGDFGGGDFGGTRLVGDRGGDSAVAGDFSPGTRRPGASGTPGSRPPARRARRSRASRRGGPSPRLVADLGVDLRPSPRRAPRARARASNLPWRIHCQICEREISAVAASSIRLLMPAAPRPPSQNEMYWKPTLTSLRRPSSVISPGRRARRRAAASGETSTSSRCLSIWFGLSPSTASNASSATSTTSGCATQVPSKPASASRSLSSLHGVDRALVGLLVLARRDQRGHAAHRERAAARGRS